MPRIRSKYLKNLLIAEDNLLDRFVGDAFCAALPVTSACSNRNLLVEIPVTAGFERFVANVELHISDSRQFRRAKQAFAKGRIGFEVRRLWSTPEPGCNALRIVERDEYGDIPRAIFGFVGTYGAICIRRHSDLDCVTVQFC